MIFQRIYVIIAFSERERAEQSQLSHVIEYINKHYTEDLTLDFITDYAHMSRSNFCLLFKRETGSTFGEYVTKLRSALAHRMLVNTDEKIGIIADAAGFGSILRMDRVFKKMYRKTPKQMREGRNTDFRKN